MTEDKAFRKAKAKFKTSYMSNAKWRKLFTAIAIANLNESQAEWRFIDGDVVLNTTLPEERNLNEIRFNDGRFQPFEYKWIKSIFIPHEVRYAEKVGLMRKQKTEEILQTITKLGKFKIEKTGLGITIYGYE